MSEMNDSEALAKRAEDLFNLVYAHTVVKYDPAAGIRCIAAALEQEKSSQSGTPYTGAPPPNWPSLGTNGRPSERHPQTAEEWDYRNDPTGQRQNMCEKRLTFAGDLADPRAPDQMAIVHRLDIIMLISELTHRRAQAESYRAKINRRPFQDRVAPWMQECFGPVVSADKLERNDRFIEEALELVQSLGYSADRAHALVDYVFGRPSGDPDQEVGGVMVTLAALCLASNLYLADAGERELARINRPEVILKIRAKQAAKPKGSALP